MREDFAVHVVDDDPAVRESLKTLMQGAGYDVRCYADGRAFLDEAAGSSGCVLLDMCLKDVNGLAVQKTLVSLGYRINVIMMSAYGDIGAAVQAMRMGATDFIEKPFDLDQLLDRVRSLSDATDNAGYRLRQARHKAALIATLTPRETEVTRRIADGLSNKQVATELGISARTVETHRVHIMQKLNADSLASLVRIWIAAGDGGRFDA